MVRVSTCKQKLPCKTGRIKHVFRAKTHTLFVRKTHEYRAKNKQKSAIMAKSENSKI